MSDNVTVQVQELDVFTSSNNTTVQVQEVDAYTANSTLYNVATVPHLGDVGDVDTTNVVNGSVLVFKTLTNKWTATTTLDLQNMEGGEY